MDDKNQNNIDQDNLISKSKKTWRDSDWFTAVKMIFTGGFLIALVGILIFVVVALNFIYLIFSWEDRYNKILMTDITAEQVQLIEEQCQIEVPQDAENIELRLFWGPYPSRWNNQWHINLHYEIPSGTDGEDNQKENISLMSDPNSDETALGKMILKYGHRQALPWFVELLLIDGTIVLTIVLIRRKLKKRKLLKIQNQGQSI